MVKIKTNMFQKKIEVHSWITLAIFILITKNQIQRIKCNLKNETTREISILAKGFDVR
jgi:hypothetical protein